MLHSPPVRNGGPLSALRVSLASVVSVLMVAGIVGFAAPAGAAPTTIDLSSTVPSPATPQVYGTSITITATLGAVDATPGTVAFDYSTDGSTYVPIAACATVAVTVGSPNKAFCTTSLLPAGTQDLKATYTGDATYVGAATSAAEPYVVNLAASGMTLSVPSSPVPANTSVTMHANFTNAGAQNGNVTFQYVVGGTYTNISGCVNVPIVAFTASCTALALPIGTTTLLANYTADTNHNTVGSPADQPFAVKAISTISLAATPTSPVLSSVSVTQTATLGNGQSGLVNFKTSPDGVTYTSVSGCSNVPITVGSPSTATCPSSLPAGTQWLEAVYSGDASFLPSTSAPVAYSVTGTTTATVVVSTVPAGPVAFGTSVAISATVGSALQTGSVAFLASSNGTSYSAIVGCTSVAISGVTASCTTASLPIGTVDLEVVYLGNTTYASVTSAAFPFYVAGSAASTVSLAAAPPSPVTAGTSVSLTATVGSAQTGTVAFQSSADGVTYATITGCAAVAITVVTATCSTNALASGTQFVRAIYSGSATHAPATSTALAYAVNGSTLASVSLAASPATSAAPGASVALTASVSVGETGLVNFLYSFDGSTYTSITGCSAVAIVGLSAVCTTTAIPSGTVYLEATYLGNSTYAQKTSAAYAFLVQKQASVVNLSASPAGPMSFGTPVTITATLGAGQTGSVSFLYSFNGSSFNYITGCLSKAIVGTTVICATATLPAGTKVIQAVYSGDGAFAPNVSSTTALVVKAVAVNMTIKQFANGSRTLSAGMRTQLQAFAQQVATNHDASVTIKAYALQKTVAASKTLSIQRANAVAAYVRTLLTNLGATQVKVTASGLGRRGRTNAQSNLVFASAS